MSPQETRQATSRSSGSSTSKAAPSPRIVAIFLVAGIFCAAAAVYGSLVPLNFTYVSFGEAVDRFLQLPFGELRIESSTDWGTNVLLFIPIGFFWMGVFLADRHGARRNVVVGTAIALACVAFSALIEFTQTWFPPRVVSQRDIFAESTGGLIGIALWFGTGRRFASWVQSFLSVQSSHQRLDWFFQAYVIGLIGYSLLPLDLTIRPAELAEKFRAGKVVLIGPEYRQGFSLEVAYSVICDVVIFIPAGAAIATWRCRANCTRPLAQCFVLGLVLTAMIETGQLFVHSRTTDASDIITGTLGVVTGSWFVRRKRLGQGVGDAAVLEVGNAVPWNWLALAALYSVVLAAVFWAPFDISRDSHFIRDRLISFCRVPFGLLYTGSYATAMMQVVKKFAWYLPLGFLIGLSLRAMRQRYLSFALGLTLCLAVATTIEIGKILIPTRFADLTNVFIEICGSAVGLTASTRSTFSKSV